MEILESRKHKVGPRLSRIGISQCDAGFAGTWAISFESQLPVDITFEGVPVGGARIDLVIARQIVLELKSVDQLHNIHFVQLRSYLRAAHLHLGLLLNFNSPTLTIRRVIVD